MFETAITAVDTATPVRSQPCRVVVIWIDWYAYHVARFRGLQSAPTLTGKVAGIELVGGVGVHAGFKFREEIPADLPVQTLMPDSSWQQAGQIHLAAKLWCRLSSLNPEAVLVPGYYTLPAIVAALWAKANRRKSVLMTESTAHDHKRIWWKEKTKAILIRSLFDWAIAGGQAHVRYLNQLGFSSDRITPFYDVVDNKFFRERSLALRRQSATAFGLPRRYFLYIGRLAPEKNLDGLLAAWLIYRDNGGTWPLVIVGDGPLAEALRCSADASSYAADIHFIGHKSSSELPTYYAFAGCFVLPSTREPWGLVVNEAMASGLPVIVSNRCGCVENLVIPGRNGFIFEPSENGELARCLHQLEMFDDVQLAQMGTHSIEIVSNYSPENFGSQIAVISNT
jgi:1,2-diacylglycerol 3-alpha-glucosyltransferase